MLTRITCLCQFRQNAFGLDTKYKENDICYMFFIMLNHIKDTFIFGMRCIQNLRGPPGLF